MRRQNLEAVLLLAPAVLFLVLWFIVPLGRFLALAFTGDAKTPAPFAELAGSEVYQRVFLATLLVALMVMVITVLLAYPLAYALCRLKGFWFIVALYGVLFPLWISTLVRTFSWMLLLERNGPINRALVDIGITDKPFALLFNDTAVTIGMVHVLLPYAVLPLYSAMSRIDRRLLLASDGLGASPLATFWRVYLPLSMPGLIGGAGFVFLFALGFYITPAILGGANAITLSMLIAGFVSERLAWPLAAAASVLLLGVVLALLAVVARLVPLQQGVLAR
jgi:ABC-type spermidine/putrescine transport system permease subunit I